MTTFDEFKRIVKEYFNVQDINHDKSIQTDLNDIDYLNIYLIANAKNSEIKDDLWSKMKQYYTEDELKEMKNYYYNAKTEHINHLLKKQNLLNK